MAEYYNKQPRCKTPDGNEWFASGGGTNGCKHEFVYDELHGQAVCEKCGYVVTAEDKREALDRSMRLLFADIDTIIDMAGGDDD